MPPIVHEDAAATRRLAELALTVQDLLAAVRGADAEARKWTAQAPPLMPGMVRWGKTNELLRERLVQRGWWHDNPKGLPRTISPDRDFAIVATTGDALTGLPDRTPATKYAKGVQTVRAIGRNVQLSFDFPGVDVADALWAVATEGDALATWLLLYHVTPEQIRAEPSFTSRHATEFTGVDVELAWISDVEDVMDFEERMLAHVLAAVAKEHGEAIRDLLGVDVVVPEVPFPRITMARAHELLGTTGERGDLDPAGERAVAERVREGTGHEFVFVTRYPASVRPFYHMRPAGEPDLTLSFDLLWRGLEITTGAQREHRYGVLLSQAAEKGLGTEPMRDYLNCFRYGCPPHGGLGLGLGRLLMVLLGLDSIRDATFLFRGPNRLTP